MNTLRAWAFALALLAMPGLAAAQTQPSPGALDTRSKPIDPTPTAIFVAPAGGVAGHGTVVAPDQPLPVTGGGGVFYEETRTPLAGNATFTGATRDLGVSAGTPGRHSYFNAFYFADQAGTATIECSDDAVNWTTCAKSSLTASTPLTLTVPVMFRYHRAKLVNGSTVEGALAINASYTGA